MKYSWLLSLISLMLFTCKGDKEVGPQDYDGEYPYVAATGLPIETYQSLFISSWTEPSVTDTATAVPAIGEYSLMFKGHEWNHSRYTYVIMRRYNKTPSPYEYLNERVFGINFSTQQFYSCKTETVGFAFPARVGRYQFGRTIGYSSANPLFSNVSCDVAKDRIVVDSSKVNQINIVRLDTVANVVEGDFDLSFRIVSKDLYYSIVYPTNIRIRGRFKGPFVNY